MGSDKCLHGPDGPQDRLKIHNPQSSVPNPMSYRIPSISPGVGWDVVVCLQRVVPDEPWRLCARCLPTYPSSHHITVSGDMVGATLN